MRIKAGDRCVIVGARPGCERNIGAQLTVTGLSDVENGIRCWHFTATSRPLVVRDEEGVLYWEYECPSECLSISEPHIIKAPENPTKTLRDQEMVVSK